MKDCLLIIPELKTFSKGRNVLIAFEKDVGPALASACAEIDAIDLAKTAEIVQREMLQHTCHGGRPALICVSKANSVAVARYKW